MTPTPLIICGMGRSGTRNTANVLATHPAVRLFGEMPFGIMRSLFQLLRTADLAYGGKGYHQELWAAKKPDFMLQALNHLGKSPWMDVDDLPEPRFIGHKTPHHEQLFKHYEMHFGSIGPLPRYFYCAREPKSCWRSYKSMGWGDRTVASFIDEYTESFRHFRLMRKRADDRTVVVSLDAMLAAEDKIDWYRTTLFTPLGLELTDEIAERIAGLANNNATRKVTGHEPVRLTDAEVEAIDGDERVQAIQQAYFPAAAAASR